MIANRLTLFKNLRALYQASRCTFASGHQPANLNPYSFEALQANHWLVSDATQKKSEWTHKSNAEQLIHKVPVIQVDSNIVRCMGGTEVNAGHPQVFIMLDTRTPGAVQTCRYCGLRYAKKIGGAHH